MRKWKFSESFFCYPVLSWSKATRKSRIFCKSRFIFSFSFPESGREYATPSFLEKPLKILWFCSRVLSLTVSCFDPLSRPKAERKIAYFSGICPKNCNFFDAQGFAHTIRNTRTSTTYHAQNTECCGRRPSKIAVFSFSRRKNFFAESALHLRIFYFVFMGRGVHQWSQILTIQRYGTDELDSSEFTIFTAKYWTEKDVQPPMHSSSSAAKQRVTCMAW